MMVRRICSSGQEEDSSNSHPSRTSSSSSQINMLDYLPNSSSTTDLQVTLDSSWRLRLSALFSLICTLLICNSSMSIPGAVVSFCRRRRRRVTGTLFGNRKGHVSFVVQEHPRSAPLVIIQLASSTSGLVKEMSSGLLNIALECPKSCGTIRLYSEPLWTMYYNGRKCNSYAASRACSHSDLHVLNTIQTVSAGAGVIPQLQDEFEGDADHSEGELVYMRARFERVVGTRDSEAFYMLNPDGHGGPDLSIFLLRL